MKPISQEHNFGCGAACVAFILKKSYSEVVCVLEKTKAESKGFFCKDLVEAFSIFNRTYSYKYLKSRLRRKIHRNGVIVFIKRSSRYPSGHYLTYFNGQWMDPWRNKNVGEVRAGFRKRLPGTPIYALFPEQNRF